MTNAQPDTRPPARSSPVEPFRQYLGTWTDKEIARRARCTVVAVERYRLGLGIDEEGSQKPSRATHPNMARKGSKVDEYRDHVGVLPDAAVAEQAGVSRAAVTQYRKKHDIEPAPRSKIDDHSDLVGVLPDAAVAEQAGVSRAAVTQYRKKHDIEPAPRGAAPSAPLAAEQGRREPPPDEAGERYDWLVTVRCGEEQIRVKLKSCTLTAARNKAAALGSVIEIEEIEPPLL